LNEYEYILSLQNSENLENCFNANPSFYLPSPSNGFTNSQNPFRHKSTNEINSAKTQFPEITHSHTPHSSSKNFNFNPQDNFCNNNQKNNFYPNLKLKMAPNMISNPNVNFIPNPKFLHFTNQKQDTNKLAVNNNDIPKRRNTEVNLFTSGFNGFSNGKEKNQFIRKNINLNQLFHCSSKTLNFENVNSTFKANVDSVKNTLNDVKPAKPTTAAPPSTRKIPKHKKMHTEETENKIVLENILNGKDTRTTLMIRHIPNKYNIHTFIEDMNVEFQGKFDLIYLPLDYYNNCNLGFAFINFVESYHILHFYDLFRGKTWKRYNSEKVCELSYAKYQGKNELIKNFEKGTIMNFESQDKKNHLFYQHQILCQRLKSHRNFLKVLLSFTLMVNTKLSQTKKNLLYIHFKL